MGELASEGNVPSGIFRLVTDCVCPILVFIKTGLPGLENLNLYAAFSRFFLSSWPELFSWRPTVASQEPPNLLTFYTHTHHNSSSFHIATLHLTQTLESRTNISEIHNPSPSSPPSRSVPVPRVSVRLVLVCRNATTEDAAAQNRTRHGADVPAWYRKEQAIDSGDWAAKGLFPMQMGWNMGDQQSETTLIFYYL